MKELVLVTGATGYVAEYVISELIKRNFKVCGTVRSKERIPEVLTALEKLGIINSTDITFVEADLTNDSGWTEAISGVDYILHLASPFPSKPSSLEELLPAALEGTLRILNIAVKSNVKRIVLTSSFAAIGYGGTNENGVYTEENWTDGSNQTLSGYIRSKALTEKAAWDWMKVNGGTTELVAVNPVGIFGPPLGNDYSSSLNIVDRIIGGKIKFSPHLEFGIVDVRDLAVLELILMKHPMAVGQRFIACSEGSWTFASICRLLQDQMSSPPRIKSVIELPNWFAKILARCFPKLGISATEIGLKKVIKSDKARKLGWHPRPGEETLLDTALGLISLRSKKLGELTQI